MSVCYPPMVKYGLGGKISLVIYFLNQATVRDLKKRMIKPSANYDISVGYYQLSRAWLIILSSFVLLSLHGSRDFATTALFIPLCNRGNVPSCKTNFIRAPQRKFLEFLLFFK